MDINFEYYKVFYYVAKELNFSEAASKLFISQSAVSQSIRQLEEKLGCKLFIRDRKRVRLTQEGEILFRHIEQAFNFIKTGEKRINELHYLEQGEVRIGASDTICKYYLLPYLKKYNKLYPNIKIHVTNRTSPMCIELLRKGLIDVGVVNIPQEGFPENIAAKSLKAVQDVFIAGNRYKDLQNKQITLKELGNYPVLMLEKNSITRSFFDALLHRHNVNIVPEIELESFDLLVELAKIGLGISFVVKEFIRQELIGSEIFILDIKEKIPKRHLGIITNSSVPIPKAAEKFIELLNSQQKE
jgi:DNA-binding transcriptional LysR family regulator